MQPLLFAQNGGPVTHVLLPVEGAESSGADAAKTEQDEYAWFLEWYQGARAYFKNKQYDEAQNVLKTILEKQPYRTEAHLALAAVYARRRHFEQSLSELNLVMQHPDYREEGLRLQTEVQRVQAVLGDAA